MYKKIKVCKIFVPVRSAKTEWKKLRDNHRDSLKRQKFKSTPNTWRYASIMEFLVPHMKSREKSFSATEEFAEETEYDEKYSPATMYLQSSHVSEEEEEEDSKLSVQNEITEIAQKRRADTDIIKEIEKVCQKREKHAIEYFFESMAETTKSLPTYLQHRIKKEVLDVVCRAEEEIESYNSNANGNQAPIIE